MLRKCPSCGYSLRGLPQEHTCPECGTPYHVRAFVVRRRPSRQWAVVLYGLLAISGVALVIDALRRREWQKVMNGGIAVAIMGWVVIRDLLQRSYVMVGPTEVVVRLPSGAVERIALADILSADPGRTPGQVCLNTASGQRVIAANVLQTREVAEQVVQMIRSAKAETERQAGAGRDG